MIPRLAFVPRKLYLIRGHILLCDDNQSPVVSDLIDMNTSANCAPVQPAVPRQKQALLGVVVSEPLADVARPHHQTNGFFC